MATTNVMEDAYAIIIEGLDSQQFDAVVLDSYPALRPNGRGRGSDGRVARSASVHG